MNAVGPAIEGTPAIESKAPLGGVDWPEIEAAMGAVVGRRGVAAMFTRSLELTTPQHPWLAGLQGEAAGERALENLAAMLAAQSPSESEAANAALIGAFRHLAGRLIGRSLAERVLAAAQRRQRGGGRAFDAAQA